MSKEKGEQILNGIFDNFRKYSRDGETLVLDGENVRYDYIRDNLDPSYVGKLHDRKTFAKSALLALINKMLSASSRQASITTESLKEDFDDSESMHTGHRLGNISPYTNQLTLELRMVNDIPVLRTGGILPWQYLKIE